ncbi:MAG: hypothetical protein KC503_24790 [Myxococcales bacterium]|nr:hypothetical protein [Myxococcales bacterium]
MNRCSTFTILAMLFAGCGGDVPGAPEPPAVDPPNPQSRPAPTNVTATKQPVAIDASRTGTPNDRCEMAQPLRFGPDGVVRVRGETFNARPEFGNDVDCILTDGYNNPSTAQRSRFAGGQRYYRLTLSSERSYRIDLNAGSFYIFRGKCHPNNINAECGSDGWYGTVGEGSMYFDPRASGEYTLAVDGAHGSGFAYELTVTQLASLRNDRCANAEPLALRDRAPTVIWGTTAGARDQFDDWYPHCAPGPQVFYRVQLRGGQRYAVSLLAGFAAALYAMSPECSHDDFLDGCQKKVTGGITSLELAPRRDSIVIIAVDGNMRSPTVGLFGSRGAFKLTIEQL